MAFIDPTSTVNVATGETAAAGTNTIESANSLGRLAEDFETFLRLLTTQLQNQDPTEPLEANEFVNQLTQFSQLEQQIRTNTSLDNVVGDIRNATNVQVMSLVGTIVEGEGDNVILTGSASESGGAALFGYELVGEAAEISVRIVDENGVLVRTLDDVPSQPGRHEIVWDGSTDGDETAPDGSYRAIVDAEDEDGGIIRTEQFFVAQVNEVRVSENEASLAFSGGGEVALDRVASVFGRP